MRCLQGLQLLLAALYALTVVKEATAGMPGCRFWQSTALKSACLHRSHSY